MKMNKISKGLFGFLAVIVLTVSLALSSCSSDDDVSPEKMIIGIWTLTNAPASGFGATTYTFKNDGTFVVVIEEFSTHTGTYSFDGDYLRMYYDNNNVYGYDVTFYQNGNQMIWGEHEEGTQRFKKK